MIGIGDVRRVWWVWVDGKAGCSEEKKGEERRGAVVKSVKIRKRVLKRVGIPREKWIVETRNRVSMIIIGQTFDHKKQGHHDALVKAAQERQF